MTKITRKLIACTLVLSLCLGMTGSAFAATPDKTVNLVGIGDSMSQGYQFTDYNEEFSSTPENNHYCGWQGVSERNYLQLLQTELEKKYDEVIKTDLSLQGMQPDELLKILDWESISDDELSDGAVKHLNWWINDYQLPEDRASNPALLKQGEAPYAPYVFETQQGMSEYFKNAIEKADVFVYDIGMNYFGTSLTDRVWGGESQDRHFTDLYKACNPKTQAYIEGLRSEVEKLLKKTGMGTLDELADGMMYAYVSYLYYTNKCLKKIYSLNPDVKVIVVGLYNPHPDLYLTIDGIKVCFSDMIDMAMSSLNTYMTTLSPYRSKFKFADLATAPMSFADELYYHPGFESTDLKKLLEKEFNTLIATTSSEYYGDLAQIYIENPQIAQMFSGMTFETIDDYNAVYREFNMGCPYSIGKWEDTVKKALYEHYKSFVDDPGYIANLYVAIDSLAFGTNSFSREFMESLKNDADQWLDDAELQNYLENVFSMVGLKNVLRQIYEEKGAVLEITEYKEDSALKAYRRALKERTFNVKEFYSLLSNNGSGYDIDTSRPFFNPGEAKLEDYHMIHYQVRFNGEGAARGFGVHPSPTGIETKARAILKAYKTKCTTTKKVPKSAKKTTAKAVINTHKTIGQVVGKIIDKSRESWRNLWIRK